MIRKRLLAAAAVAMVCLLAATRTASAGDCPGSCPTACPKESPKPCAPPAPACCADTGLKKVCQPITDVKKVTKTSYSDVCEDFCTPKCSLTGGLFSFKKKCCAEKPECNSCASGNCAKCGKVRVKKTLVIKFKTHEECVNKCVVGYEACAPKACELPCVVEGSAPAVNPGPGAEKLPISPTPDKKMPPGQLEKK